MKRIRAKLPKINLLLLRFLSCYGEIVITIVGCTLESESSPDDKVNCSSKIKVVVKSLNTIVVC